MGSKMTETLPPAKKSIAYVADMSTALECAKTLEQGSKVVAVDTEHYCYTRRNLNTTRFPYPVKRWNTCGPFVAIMQVSTMNQTYVFDVLALGHLPCQLKNMLEGTDTVKLVFDYHAEACALDNTFGVQLVHVLDLQALALQLAGGRLIKEVRLNKVPSTVSLQNVVLVFFGEELDKSFQRFNWKKSYIPYAAIRYAAEDARILICILQFIATACSLAWPGISLNSEMVENVVETLVQTHGCRVRSSVQAFPEGGLPSNRIYRVFRHRSSCIYE